MKQSPLPGGVGGVLRASGDAVGILHVGAAQRHRQPHALQQTLCVGLAVVVVVYIDGLVGDARRFAVRCRDFILQRHFLVVFEVGG